MTTFVKTHLFLQLFVYHCKTIHFYVWYVMIESNLLQYHWLSIFFKYVNNTLTKHVLFVLQVRILYLILQRIMKTRVRLVLLTFFSSYDYKNYFIFKCALFGDECCCYHWTHKFESRGPAKPRNRWWKCFVMQFGFEEIWLYIMLLFFVYFFFHLFLAVFAIYLHNTYAIIHMH